MGLINLIKAIGEAKREFDREARRSTKQESHIAKTPLLRVNGTIYHQKELSKLKGNSVQLTLRKTKADDYYKSYDYQVYADGVLVGGLNDYAFQRGAIRNMRAVALIDRNGNDRDKINLYIPYDGH